jgi:hypothetical protein
LIARGLAVYVALLFLAVAAFAMGLSAWRRSFVGLLLYLPVSGIPIVLAYPSTQVPVLAKDFLFVVPVYLGFVAWAISERRSIVFATAPVVPMVLFTVIVLGQALNPSVPGILVGAIGAKVWLLYLPLFFVAYHFVATKDDLQRLFRILLWSTVFPITVGLLEVVLIYGGSAGIVYGIFGGASAAATQGYTQFNYAGGGSLRRIPGTFSFVTQYYGFLVAAITIAYASWRSSALGTPMRKAGRILWIVALAAALLSGAREAFLMVPLLVVLVFVLERPGALRVTAGVFGFAAAAAIAIAAIGTNVGSLYHETSLTFSAEWGGLIMKSVPEAVSHTWAGFGTGVATGASRYAATSSDLMKSLQVPWAESWYAKTILELGIAGFLVVIALFGGILVRSARSHRSLRDPQLRAISAALLGFLCWAVLSAVKGPFIDLDPVNVYFWIFAGALARVPELEHSGGAA